MEEENYLNPQPKSDQKIQSTTKQEGSSSSSKTPVYILVGIVLLSIAFLIFGLVVLRINAPTLRLSNVVVRDLRYNSSSSLNITFNFIADINLHNMNFGRFQFPAATAALMYGNATIGEATINAGRVGGRNRRRIGEAAVEVIAGPSANYMNISRDIESNRVRVVSVAELRGEIRVMKIVKRHRTAFMNCSMELDLSDQQVQGLSCR